MSRRMRNNSARLRIESSSEELLSKIVNILDKNFNCFSTSHPMPSDRGGYFLFVNLQDLGDGR